ANPQLAVLEAEREARTTAYDARQRVERAMEQFAFHRALEAIWEFIGAVNRYIDTTQPWALAKDPAKASVLNRVLATLADSLRFRSEERRVGKECRCRWWQWRRH